MTKSLCHYSCNALIQRLEEVPLLDFLIHFEETSADPVQFPLQFLIVLKPATLYILLKYIGDSLRKIVYILTLFQLNMKKSTP